MKAMINGANINYVDGGNPSGMPVVFVHGFPFSHKMWRGQLDSAGKLYRVVAYDVKGHGESDVGDGQYTLESHVNDLIALLDHLNIRKTVIVGLSMGGYITLRALERNPERFMAAALCDTRSEADTNEGRIRRATTALDVKKTGSADIAETYVKTFFAANSFTSNPDAIALIKNIISHTPPLSIAGTLIALAARTDTTPSLASISVPTLILVGEHDVTTPPASSAAMHKAIRGSEMHIVPSAAHMSNLENPDFFNEKLLSFLKRVSSSPR